MQMYEYFEFSTYFFDYIFLRFSLVPFFLKMFLNITYFHPFSAILELDDPLDFTKWQKPICMPTWATKKYENEKGVLAGWGWDGQSWPEDIKRVDAVIWSEQFSKSVMDTHHETEQIEITK